MSFQDLGLSQPLLRALDAAGYSTPTPIQEQAIPRVLAGTDLLGIARTGTGKTAAFVLPSLDRLFRDGHPRARQRSTRMLVLAPTRELAGQIADSAVRYGKFATSRITTAFGGVPIGRQARALAGGVDILVATPGRLLDLIEQRLLTLGDVEILVLDEADQMLDLGFIHALKRIVRLLPRDRQTLLFSATMPKAIRDLAADYLRNPEEVSVTPVASTVQAVEQFVTFVDQGEKPALLALTLKAEGLGGGDPQGQALVFSRTKHGADKLVRYLANAGIEAVAIHGNKSQPQRERALQDFRKGLVRVLVATDIAARGIDVAGVSHVINTDVPDVPEQYVHRIGRTARAGASGVAIAFCAEDERAYLRDIEKLTRQKVPVVPLPDNFLAEAERIKAQRVKAIGADPAPRDERQRGQRPPPRPRATHSPVPSAQSRQYGRPSRSGGGNGRSGGRPGGSRAQG